MIMCHGSEELSPDDSYANGMIMLQLDYTFSPFALKYRWDDEAFFITHSFSPFVFDPV